MEKEGVVLNQVRNTPEGASRLKSHHYLNNILGKREIGNGVNKEGIFSEVLCCFEWSGVYYKGC